MTQSYWVTLVVPVYQVEAYLPECIDSIVRQDTKDFSCIFVDDGTKDRCDVMIDEVSKLHSDRFMAVHQKNKGLSGARNTGIDLVNSKYVMFLDSDDIAEPNFVSRLLETAERDQADIVECGFTKFYDRDTDGKTVLPTLHGVHHISDTPSCITDFTITAWNKIYKTALFKEQGVRYPQGLVFEDTSTTPLLLARSQTVSSINDSLILYRQRKGSIMNVQNDHALDLYALAEILRDDTVLKQYPREQEAHVIFRMLSLISKLCKRKDNDAEVRKAFRWLNDWNPAWRESPVWREKSSETLTGMLYRLLVCTQNPRLVRLAHREGK